MLGHDITQACVHHVRRGVRTRNRQAALTVDLGVSLLAHRHAALGQGAAVHAQASDRGLHVVNLNDAAARESNRTVSASWPPISA